MGIGVRVKTATRASCADRTRKVVAGTRSRDPANPDTTLRAAPRPRRDPDEAEGPGCGHGRPLFVRMHWCSARAMVPSFASPAAFMITMA